MEKTLLTLAGGLFFTAAGMAAHAQSTLVVKIAPPPAVEETVPAVPAEHPGWVWHPGYHRWDGDHYVWVPGSYVEAPYEHATWVPGHWDRSGEGYVWVEGQWRH